MAIATLPARHPTALELWRTRAYLLPCALLAAVVAFSVAEAQKQARISRVELLAHQSESAESSSVAVRCQLRQGFALRLALKAQVLASAVLAAPDHAGHAPGARCRVQPERP